jgi:hypothetical protein
VVVTGEVFVISVTGEMSAALREQFDDLDVTIERGVSRVRVVGPDSSALHGVLNRIDGLGLELIDVRLIDTMPAEDRPPPQHP